MPVVRVTNVDPLGSKTALKLPLASPTGTWPNVLEAQNLKIAGYLGRQVRGEDFGVALLYVLTGIITRQAPGPLNRPRKTQASSPFPASVVSPVAGAFRRTRGDTHADLDPSAR